jgi:hypothetical protein
MKSSRFTDEQVKPRVSEARRLKALEDENAKLKKLLTESMLDVSMLREMLSKTSEVQRAA